MTTRFLVFWGCSQVLLPSCVLVGLSKFAFTVFRGSEKRLTYLYFLCLVLTMITSESHDCRFPPRWTGMWYQKGVQQPIKIEGRDFSSKGACLNYSGNMFLIEDQRERCFRCVVIYEKHPNVLQYKETYCDEYKTLDLACIHLTVDAYLYSMFRVNGTPVPCPFRGPLTFTYTRTYGECKHPLSTVDPCIEESRLLFRFQACADIRGSESSIEELTCLGTWKEGSAHYLVGKMGPQKAHGSHGEDEHNYRCFVYEQHHEKAYYQISQSLDATCDGLVSIWEGSRIMRLTKGKHPTIGCQFPSWLVAPHRWHTLDGRTSYFFSHKNTTFRIIQSRTDRPDTKVTCTEEVISSQNWTTIVAHSMQGCTNGFVCLNFVQRDRHIVEVQMGKFARRPQDSCLAPYFDETSTEFVTLVTPSSASYVCPQFGENDGLQIQAGRVQLRNDLCPDSTVLAAGCRYHQSLDFLLLCSPTERERLSFRCQGIWEENGRSYLIGGLKGSKSKFCFVYYQNGTMTHLSGLSDTCSRDVVPGVTGNLPFNLTAAGECDAVMISGTTSTTCYYLTVIPVVSLILNFR